MSASSGSEHRGQTDYEVMQLSLETTLPNVVGVPGLECEGTRRCDSQQIKSLVQPASLEANHGQEFYCRFHKIGHESESERERES